MDTRLLYGNQDRVKDGVMTDACDTTHTALFYGFFTKVCQFDENAFSLLLSWAQREEPGMEWGENSLMEYIKFTWLRLLEQKRVVWVKAADSAQFKPHQLTQYFLLFHSGLFVTKHGKLQPVFLLATQVYNERLFTIHVSGLLVGRNKTAVELVSSPPPGAAVVGSLQRATFYSTTDPLLLLNTSLPFVYNLKHILVDRKFRVKSYLQDKGVISSTMTSLQLMQKLEEWMLESVCYCARSFFGCAVPQMHYKLIDNKYCGCRQLLLPLFCGTPEAILALPVEYVKSYQPCSTDKLVFGAGDVEKRLNGEVIDKVQVLQAGDACYKAHTAIPLTWARMNARLVDLPQAHWLVKK